MKKLLISVVCLGAMGLFSSSYAASNIEIVKNTKFSEYSSTLSLGFAAEKSLLCRSGTVKWNDTQYKGKDAVEMTCDMALFDIIKESRGLSLVRSQYARENWNVIKEFFNAKGTIRYVFSVTGAEKFVALEGHSHRIKWGDGSTLEENFEVESETFKQFYIDRDELRRMMDSLCKNNKMLCAGESLNFLIRAAELQTRAELQKSFNETK